MDTTPARSTTSVLVPAPRARTAPGTPAVDLAVETVEPVTGLRHRRVRVEDESDTSATRPSSQQAFAAQDQLLRDNPAWCAPSVVDGALVAPHEVARWVYASGTMRQWRTHLVPTARALYVLQRPHESHLLPGWGPVDAGARRFIVDGLDAIGIRTRARVMQDVVRRARAAAAPRGQRPVWVSLASGAAVPVLDAVRDGVLRGGHLQLVDLDPRALAFAAELATQQGLVEGRDFTVLHRDLVTGIVARDGLVQELGDGRAAVVDALGIFEYFSDASCVRLLRNAYRLLAPGGVLVVANMLSDRPELDLNQRGLGWPAIHPRSVTELVDLVERAGLPLHRTTVSIPQDGVYAVVDVTR